MRGSGRILPETVRRYVERALSILTSRNLEVNASQSGQETRDATAKNNTSGMPRKEESRARGHLSASMYPDYSDSNPYQHELGKALGQENVTVELSRYDSRWKLLAVLGGRDRPDVVHLHWLSAYFVTSYRSATALRGARLLVELAVLRLSGIRVVWTVHNLFEHERRCPRVELVVKRLASRLVNVLITHCERASETVADTLRLSESKRQSVVAVPHGHYVDSYPAELDRTEARESLGYDPNETVFLYFGVIRPYKNVLKLLEAFSSVEAPGARLSVVGNPLDDDIAEAIRSAAEQDDRVRTTLEFVPDEEVQRYMHSADVVVLPYGTTLMSGAAMLAMSFGLPVVAPKAGCVGELLTASENVCYDPADPDGLTDALQTALDADLAAMGAANRRYVEQFDWETIGRRTRRLYESDDARRSR